MIEVRFGTSQFVVVNTIHPNQVNGSPSGSNSGHMFRMSGNGAVVSDENVEMREPRKVRERERGGSLGYRTRRGSGILHGRVSHSSIPPQTDVEGRDIEVDVTSRRGVSGIHIDEVIAVSEEAIAEQLDKEVSERA